MNIRSAQLWTNHAQQDPVHQDDDDDDGGSSHTHKAMI
jgi:hypothetical protein